MIFEQNKSLLPYNTFGVDVACKEFVTVDSLEDIFKVIETTNFLNSKRLVLGGGSNILFTKDFDGLIIKNNLLGRNIVSEGDTIEIKTGAGENWHEFVQFCVENGFGGIENLSLIPGNVGASPMQNIGAYGVEIKDVVSEVEYIDFETGNLCTINAEDCEFEYRSSVFKTILKGKVFITSVTYKLTKNPVFNTSYGAIEQELERTKLDPTLRNISQAVMNIRRSKLPDPKLIGNAGSFFKNPVVSISEADELKSRYTDIPVYPAVNGMKVAAGWLIEKAGWKGKRINGYGVHEKQALVLVNYGGSTGNDINELANEIQRSIQAMFGINLEKEVNII